jgi:hypothetical protein
LLFVGPEYTDERLVSWNGGAMIEADFATVEASTDYVSTFPRPGIARPKRDLKPSSALLDGKDCTINRIFKWRSDRRHRIPLELQGYDFFHGQTL